MLHNHDPFTIPRTSTSSSLMNSMNTAPHLVAIPHDDFNFVETYLIYSWYIPLGSHMHRSKSDCTTDSIN